MRNAIMVVLFLCAVVTGGIAKASPDVPALWIVPVAFMAVFGWMWSK
jgi:hypothetical protein